jgi:hypothetical protein
MGDYWNLMYPHNIWIQLPFAVASYPKTTDSLGKLLQKPPNLQVNVISTFCVYGMVVLAFFFFWSTTVLCGPWLHYSVPLFRTVPDHWQPIFLLTLYVNSLRPRPSLSLTWPSCFPCSLHCSCCHVFWHSLVLRSFSLTAQVLCDSYRAAYSYNQYINQQVHLTLIVLMWRIGWAHNNARK